MKIFMAFGGFLVTLCASASARAFEFERVLKQVFGSSDPKDLGGPLFALIAGAGVIFFWAALKIGKRRQRRMIGSYDDALDDYAERLRRGKG